MKRYLYSLMSGQRHDLAANLIVLLLLPFSYVYRFCVWLLRSLYRRDVLPREYLSVPVISIGNLTMGGSGKSPMAIYLAKMFLAKNKRPAIIARGYKPGLFNKKRSAADEQLMMSSMLRNVPVVTNPDRFLAASEAVNQNEADVILLDDGFQHWRLKRDLDIVLVDSVNPFGNGRMIPAGILREPIAALKRADIIMLTKSDLGNPNAIRKYIELNYPQTLVVESVHSPRSLTNIYTGEVHGLRRLICPAIAFCAIGDPVSFKATLLALGTDIKEFVSYLDHHEYSWDDMKRMKALCRQIGLNTLITTSKDAVKLGEFGDFWKDFHVYSLNIEIEIVKGHKELSQRIDHVLGR